MPRKRKDPPAKIEAKSGGPEEGPNGSMAPQGSQEPTKRKRQASLTDFLKRASSPISTKAARADQASPASDGPVSIPVTPTTALTAVEFPAGTAAPNPVCDKGQKPFPWNDRSKYSSACAWIADEAREEASWDFVARSPSERSDSYISRSTGSSDEEADEDEDEDGEGALSERDDDGPWGFKDVTDVVTDKANDVRWQHRWGIPWPYFEYNEDGEKVYEHDENYTDPSDEDDDDEDADADEEGLGGPAGGFSFLARTGIPVRAAKRSAGPLPGGVPVGVLGAGSSVVGRGVGMCRRGGGRTSAGARIGSGGSSSGGAGGGSSVHNDVPLRRGLQGSFHGGQDGKAAARHLAAVSKGERASYILNFAASLDPRIRRELMSNLRDPAPRPDPRHELYTVRPGEEDSAYEESDDGGSDDDAGSGGSDGDTDVE